MAALKPWIEASRPRTLPLSLACIGMGTFLAVSDSQFDGLIFALCIITTVFLQVLSNLSNDYGDWKHGADSEHRKGPDRAVQAGIISSTAMRNAIVVFALLAFISGFGLIWTVFGSDLNTFLFFLILGIGSIFAAITYTSGKKPYGYAGLGDFSVLVFFGLIGVMGTYFLFTKTMEWNVVLPALSCGLFSVAVLNVNNIRDIESDRIAGKKSIPVRIGRSKAIWYHWLLLFTGISTALLFVLINFQSYWQLTFLITIPLFIINGRAIAAKKDPKELDPYLKQMALSTLIFVITFGLGLILS